MMSKVFFPICALTWRVNNYASRREKVYIEEMKIQETVNFFLILLVTY